jgi:Ulp1 family protease
MPQDPTHPHDIGPYNSSNVACWSRRVPGGDLHALDKVFFPIHLRNSHWVGAIAYPQLATIYFLDSLPSPATPEIEYLSHLVHYLNDDHS